MQYRYDKVPADILDPRLRVDIQQYRLCVEFLLQVWQSLLACFADRPQHARLHVLQPESLNGGLVDVSTFILVGDEHLS